MRVFISGGCKLGKSTLAQRIACLQGGRRVYIATMRPRDSEDEARVWRHRAEREGQGFETVERSADIGALAGAFPRDASLLLDSVTALVAEEMFGGGAFDPRAGERAAEGLLALSSANPNIVAVSDAIFSDAERYDTATEAYRRSLAAVDRALARAFDAVVEVVSGLPILYKGDERVAALVHEAAAGVMHGAGTVYGAAGVRPLGR